MTQTFTPDDLVRYLYQDTSDDETQEIEKALQTDSRLRNEYEQLQQGQELVSEIVLTPSDKCIDHIMGYARAMNMKALVN